MNRRGFCKSLAAGFLVAKFGPASLGAQAESDSYIHGMRSVEEFGIFPDGITNWEADFPGWRKMLEASVSHGVYWPPGYYATAINFNNTLSGARMHFCQGSVIGGVFHLISGRDDDVSRIVKVSRHNNIVTIKTRRPHRFSVGDLVQVREVRGLGNAGSSFNADKVLVVAVGEREVKISQLGPDEAGVTVRASSINVSPLMDVKITGRLATTDRLGTINNKNCSIESCWIMNDPSRHIGNVNQSCRGAHIYRGTDSLYVGELIIDYAGGSNTDAAFAVDGEDWNPSNCLFGKVVVRDERCSWCLLDRAWALDRRAYSGKLWR